MAGVKISTFLGKAPKISPELLPASAAQVARNCKLYSGDLIPYTQPLVVANSGRTGVVKTLYGLRNPQAPDVVQPLSWPTEVNIAIASSILEDEQRFYYSGDGAPKVSNYALATTGSGAYPIGYYDLGLPIPLDSEQLTTTAQTFTTKTVSTFARDAGNIATIVTSAAHGLRSGNSITISGFGYIDGSYAQSGSVTIVVTINDHGLASGASVVLDFTSGAAVDGTFTIANVTTNTFEVTAAASATTSGAVRWDIREFNATSVEATVVNSTTFTYFSPGAQVATSAYGEGRVDLGGLTQARSYVFTWITPWGEESIASKPSDNLYIKEGSIVDVTDIPTAAPSGDNFIRGVRLYRTLASLSGTEYFRLTTLWFPTQVASVQRTDNISRVTLAQPHNFGIDDRFKISASSVASFNITGGVVTEIIDDYTFEYAQTASNVAATATTTGMLYHDVSQNPPTTPAQYWGDGDYDFLDDFDSRTLLDVLSSDDYDPPPQNLQGLVSIQNNILVGFVGNTLYFSEPGFPHAWPARYATPIGENTIVALAAVNGSLLILTKGYPYIASLTDPAAGISLARIDALYPCQSAQSVVSMSYGVVWSTNDGLAVYSPGAVAIITKALYNSDTWTIDVDPSTVVAQYYSGNYFASHSQGSFVFEQDTQVGGFFIDAEPIFTASWFDARTNKFYYAAGTNGDVYEWDNLAQPAQMMEWKSKVITTTPMINLGAARIIADFSANPTKLWAQSTQTWAAAAGTWSAPNEILFSMFVDKQIVFSAMVGGSYTFRLPTGYRSDTFEFSVESDVRVRAIHLAETPLGLREV
jgi:hypothetical protein